MSKPFLCMGSGKIFSWTLALPLELCRNVWRTKISGGANILGTSIYSFPTGFFRKWNTVSVLEVPKWLLRAGSWKLNTFSQGVVLKSFQQFQESTNISVRELIFKIVHRYYGCLLPFLVNLETVFWYNNCQNYFFVLDIEN